MPWMNGDLVIINPPLRKLRLGLLAPIIALLPALSAVAQLPFSKTQVAGPVRATTATLNGMGVARGNLTTAWFEWGTDRTYGNTTAPQDIGSGTHVVRVTAPLTGLLEGGVYHYRLVLSNSVGVVSGFDSMFTTSMKVQNWGSFSYGLPAIPPGLTNLSGIASGHGLKPALRRTHTCALS